jgi:hypothetical protein
MPGTTTHRFDSKERPRLVHQINAEHALGARNDEKIRTVWRKVHPENVPGKSQYTQHPAESIGAEIIRKQSIPDLHLYNSSKVLSLEGEEDWGARDVNEKNDPT